MRVCAAFSAILFLSSMLFASFPLFLSDVLGFGITPMSIGAVNDFSVDFQWGKLVGKKIREDGDSIAVVALAAPWTEKHTFKTTDYFTFSPFVSAQHLQWYLNGIISNGVTPMLLADDSAEFKNALFFSGLVSRGIFVPIYYTGKSAGSYGTFLKAAGYDAPVVSENSKPGTDLSALAARISKLRAAAPDASELAREIFKRSVTMVKYAATSTVRVASSKPDFNGAVVAVGDPAMLTDMSKVRGYCVVYSSAPEYIDLAVQAFEGLFTPSGVPTVEYSY